jgi:hypothetical protein
VGADFQVRDGMNQGNSAFYFLPPLVPSPTYDGEFDPTLAPLLTAFVTGPYTPVDVGDLNGDGYPDWEPLNAGACTDPVTYPLPAPTLGTGESYATAWNSKKRGPDAVTIGAVYRVCIALQAGNEILALGWRDVMPDDGGANQPRNTDQSPTYQFSAGNNLPVKFRIETGVLNEALCVNTDGTIDYDCTAALLTTAGDEAVCVGSTCSITAGGLTEPTLFLVERLPCYGDDPNIPDGHEPDAQGVNWIQGLDLPQYAGCIQVTVFDPTWDGFTTAGVVGACFFDDSGPPLETNQDESLRLHLQAHGAQTVVALDRVPAAAELSGACAEIYAAGPPPAPDAALGTRLAWQLRKGWHTIQRAVGPWLAPPQALAFHTGFGGHTALDPPPDDGGISGSVVAVSTAGPEGPMVQFHVTEGGAKVYMLAWALPSQMEKHQLGETDGVVAPEPLSVNVGTPVTVKVKVTDNGETEIVDQSSCVPDPLGGEVCGYLWDDPRPVKKAEVHFDATNDATLSAASVFTTFDQTPYGIAEVTVTPTKSGTSLVTASGYGIGARPLSGFGGFVPPPDGEITLLRGSLSFEIYACDNAAAGFISPIIGGGLDAAWQGAQLKQQVPVNLGGNVSGTADLYVGHDCSNLYLAFAVGADDANNNSLRFVFDNQGGGESADDNIISLTKIDGAWVYQDRYLSATCVGSKQANCGPEDPAGMRHGTGAAGFDAGINKFVYEFQFPLKSGDADHDFQRKLGETLGFYLAVSLGSGTKGNTEWPDQRGNFKSYQPYVITQY